MANRQKVGERVVRKREKVDKWEMASYTHAGKYSDSPSYCFDALKVQSRKAAVCAERDLKRSTSRLPPKFNTHSTLRDPTDSAVFYDLRSSWVISIKGVTWAE